MSKADEQKGKLYTDLPVEDAFGYETLREGEGYILWDNPHNVLDEAKAEFPSTEYDLNEADETTLAFRIDEFKEWFDKWFGKL